MTISNIHIEKAASYTQEGGVDIGELAEVNFFYGTNGSGKTTISKILADKNEYPQCDFTGGEDTIIQVYNEDFKNNEVFESEIKGVFTLGSESKEIEDSIKEKTEEIETIKSSIEGFRKTKDSKVAQLEALEVLLKKRSWEVKTDLESNPNFKDAFQGFRGNKETYYKQVLTESESNQSTLNSYEELSKKAERLFGDKPSKVSLPVHFDFNKVDLIIQNSIFQESIRGKEDSDISDLISKLRNSDWVKDGITHLENCDSNCPFCQTEIDVSKLKNTLNSYFDETYEKRVQELKSHKTQFESELEKFETYKKNILQLNNPLIDKNIIKTKLELIESKINSDIKIIDSKIISPSQSFSFESKSDILDDYKKLIDSCRQESTTHNASVDNYDVEHTQLKGEVWKFIANKLDSDIQDYQSTKIDLENGIEGINTGISEGESRVFALQTEISELETKINSLKPTITEINKTLKDFGFHGFTIQEIDNNSGKYEIVRPDKSDARNTLSEGEKTFISFLYFYYRINGVLKDQDVGKKRIIVIDDPISSLDSNVVFVVSSMIKKLIKNLAEAESLVSQLFVLTHNIYFHKEVSYEGHGVPTANRKYWLVRKTSGVSNVEHHHTNPVTSSYQMMWKEIDDAQPLTICNILRRILETYFQHYGDTHLEDLPDSLEGDEKLICRSLISWIHDGSHNIMDDLYISLGDDTVERYKEVFKKIFVHKGQIAHFNMMMGIGV